MFAGAKEADMSCVVVGPRMGTVALQSTFLAGQPGFDTPWQCGEKS